MQAKSPSEIPSLNQPYPVEQDERLLNAEAQTGSTAPASEQAWLMVALVFLALTVGVYWFNDRHSEQPDRSTAAVGADRATGERVVDVVTSDPILDDRGNRTRSWPKDLGTPQPVPVSDQNERLVRRFYDEVINRQQFDLMDDLFAEEVTVGHDGLMTTSSLAALKQRTRATVLGYVGLSYEVEQLATSGDWVHVYWSAVGRRLFSWTEYPPAGEPQVWSGDTLWQVVAGRIVRMRTYHVSKPQPYRPDDDGVRLPGHLQDSQELAEYQLRLSSGYPLP